MLLKMCLLLMNIRSTSDALHLVMMNFVGLTALSLSSSSRLPAQVPVSAAASASAIHLDGLAHCVDLYCFVFYHIVLSFVLP